MKKLEIIGKNFGRWTVISSAETRETPSGSKKAYWKCKCSCGTEKEVRAEHLLRLKTKSCGCHKSEKAAQQQTTHGGRDLLIYGVWTQMLQRCGNPKNKGWKRYGGRGIIVCDEWKNFDPFYEWSKLNGYAIGLTIDRINNNGNYEPSNCRWVTNLVNCRNR